MWGDVPTIDVLGIPVASLQVGQALDAVERLHAANGVSAGAPARVYYVNAHTLNLAWRDARLREVLRTADLVLNDGSGVALAARLQRRRFPANLNGSDLNPLLLALAARHGWPVYFLGGSPGVAERTAGRWQRELPGLQVAGAHHGYLDGTDHEVVAGKIRASGAELLLVAMGNPLQELWLATHLPATGVRVGVGVGAFFDFSAGVVARCPEWMSRYGVEWLYRLRLEPRRLWRRYVLGNPLFVLRALRSRNGRR
jgi:exopolysaccharide biosynthesis WecB/TagA/CpsF family protein